MHFWLQNPNKSSTNKKKLASIAFLVLVSLVLTLSAIGSLFFVVEIWQEKAFNIDTKTQTEVQVQNGNEVRIYNYTYTVENYLPFRNWKSYPIIYIRNSTHVIEQLNYTKQNLTKLEIKIDSFEWKRSYGDKELSPPYKIVNPPSFPIVEIKGMTKTTLLINWRYNNTRAREILTIFLRYASDPNGPQVVSDGLNMEIWRTLEGVLPYLFFVASGFMFSLYAFGMGKLMNDYGVLSKFPEAYQKAGASKKKEMEKSLGNIVAFPKKVGGGWRLLFGLSIFVVKALVNNSCKEHDESIDSYKIAPFRRKSLSKIFSKYKKQTFEKIEDILPELKTILVVIAFLASVGITFSFNVGAAAAFLYSLALFYFFFNLGSIFQFVIESNRDRYWTIWAIFLAIFAVLLPEIIDILRLAS